tara:strand:+ start:423 stop:803 length:381 start_codon:yes stop_codon:yes gene_type:complete
MQLIKYGITQISVYAIDLLVFIFFYEFLDFIYVFANTFSKLIACLLAFFIHKFVTFKSQGKLKEELLKYFGFLPINIIFGTLLLGFLLEFSLDYKIAKILSDVIVFIFSFIVAKKFIFKSFNNSND